MYIEQLYTNCLAEAAYYIQSEGEAAIVDPIRETEQYVELARSRGARITYIFETHFHADFVSGHLDLEKATGAPIVFGPGAETEFPIHQAQDGEKLKLGAIEIEVIHTPGHTPESTCYLVYDEEGKANAIFTGDTLFVGDVGRPDLLDGKMTKESLAGMMYESLTNKIVPLADDVIVYPAHGPGSSCGKSIGKETWSTIGKQKQTNYALQPRTKEEFIRQLTSGLVPPPRYYFEDARINKTNYQSLDAVMKKSLRELTIGDLDRELERGAIVLDTRTASEFELGFIPHAINTGLDGQYAWQSGAIMEIHKPIVLVCEPGKEEESVRRLARVGYDNVAGYLGGGIHAWHNAGRTLDTVQSIEPGEFADYRAKGMEVLDVRNSGEYESGHVEGAIHIPVGQLPQRIGELNPETEYLVHCAGGYRSMIASSILKRAGFEHILNVHGGFGKMLPFVTSVTGAEVHA